MADDLVTDPKTGRQVHTGLGPNDPPATPQELEDLFGSLGLRGPAMQKALHPPSIGPQNPASNPARSTPERLGIASQAAVGPLATGMEMVAPPLAGMAAGALLGLEAAPFAATAAGGAAGYLSGLAHGDANPSSRAMVDAGMEGGGQVFARLAPWAGLRMGLWGHPDKLDPEKAAQAFLSERKTAGVGGGIAVRDANKAKLRIGEVGAQKEAIETASPQRFNRRWLAGTADEVKPSAGTPESDIAKAREVEHTSLEQNANVQEDKNPAVRLKREALNSTNANKHPFFRDPELHPLDMLENNQMSAREFGNYGKDLRTEGRAVTQSKLNAKGGVFIPESDKIAGAVKSRMGEKAADISSSLIPDLKPVNSRLSKLYTINDAAEKLPNPSNIWAVGRRAGVGAMAGGEAGREAGNHPVIGAGLGAVGGIFGLTPNMLSRYGYGVGRLGEFGPTLARGIVSEADPYEKKPVRLKK